MLGGEGRIFKSSLGVWVMEGGGGGGGGRIIGVAATINAQQEVRVQNCMQVVWINANMPLYRYDYLPHFLLAKSCRGCGSDSVG